MGAAAYNRGSKLIAQQCAAQVDADMVRLEMFNAMPKRSDARRPFGPIEFAPGHGGFWASCPVSGYGFWYRDLRDAIKSFDVDLVSVSGDTFHAVPRSVAE